MRTLSCTIKAATEIDDEGASRRTGIDNSFIPSAWQWRLPGHRRAGIEEQVYAQVGDRAGGAATPAPRATANRPAVLRQRGTARARPARHARVQNPEGREMVVHLPATAPPPWARRRTRLCRRDLGAEGHQVERPGAGDDTRHWRRCRARC